MSNDNEKTTNLGTIYAVIDLVANMIIGGLQIHRHDGPAMRQFNDAANMKGSIVNMHPEDFDLVQLGHITDDLKIQPDYRLVITGKRWLQLVEITEKNNTLAKEQANA